MGKSALINGRQIFWCPDGSGYPPYCPRETDGDEYIYCCTYGYDVSVPSCCRFPLHTGLIYALIFGAAIVIFVFIFLSCWFCPTCPLARKMRQNSRHASVSGTKYKKGTPPYERRSVVILDDLEL